CSRSRAERLLHRLRNRFACSNGIQEATKNACLTPITSHGALRDTFHRLMKGTPVSIDEADRHHDASNLPDLVGLRVTGDYTRLNVRALLPQIHGPELMAYLDMPGIQPPATAALWNSLPDAAAAAFALPAIDTRNSGGARARTAAVHTARRHLSVTRMSQLMHIRRRTVRRLDRAKLRPADVRAVRMQLTLRNIRKAQGASPWCGLGVAI
ncbi:MAG: hypothetical protein VB934_12500, partial [Polyangiaceae bacterium]